MSIFHKPNGFESEFNEVTAMVVPCFQRNKILLFLVRLHAFLNLIFPLQFYPLCINNNVSNGNKSIQHSMEEQTPD